MRKNGSLLRRLCRLLTVFVSAAFLAFPAAADTVTDEINEFYITVDVNEDASLNMVYHILWTVLDDQVYGPLDWMEIGLPNSSHEGLTALTDTVSSISDTGDSAKIYLNRKYYAGESVLVEFSFQQDRMYQIDKYTEGETVYIFTPAWFDSMEVKDLKIFWNKDRAIAWQPDSLTEDGYLVFGKALSPGEKYTLSVTYPTDAFGFSASAQFSSETGTGSSTSVDIEIILAAVLGVLFAVLIIAVPIGIIIAGLYLLGKLQRGFGIASDTKKKITRTLIEYYKTCPSCGAARVTEKDVCEYCGRSMIKKKQVVEEKDIIHPEKYSSAGTYAYGSVPNTFVHVNVINVPRSGKKHSGGSRLFGSSSSRSSSSRSSCACACASSCACACACASSGRAGCSVKGFFDRDRHNRIVRIEAREN